MNGNYYGDGNQPQPPQNNGYQPQGNGYPPQNNGYQPQGNGYPPQNNGYIQPNGQQFQPPLNNNIYGPQDPGKGLAAGSLVCGIIAIIFAWFFGIGAIFGIVAIVLGVISGNKSSEAGFPRNGMAVAGLVCGIIGTVFGAICAAYMVCACLTYSYGTSGLYKYYY